LREPLLDLARKLALDIEEERERAITVPEIAIPPSPAPPSPIATTPNVEISLPVAATSPPAEPETEKTPGKTPEKKAGRLARLFGRK
jgi:hypothetical protein